MAEELPKHTVPVTVTEKPVEDQGSTEASPPQEPKTFSSRLDDWYIWEIGGVVVSAACILAIIGLLIGLNGKPLPQWGFTTPEKIINGKIIPQKTINIALNSVISWISTVGKIAILIPITKGLGQLKWVWFAEAERRLDDLEKFDSATRGLSGSAKLLWRLKGRHFATIGAIAVILALGFDPFIQNLVHYDTVYLPDPKQTNLIKSTPVYDYPGPFGELDVAGKGAISAGLYGTGQPTYRVPDYSCDTGNCTWENYPSLALGVHCADLTTQLTQICANGTNADPIMGAACDYRLPNGMNLGTDGRTVLAVNASRDAIIYTNYTNPLAVIQAIGAYKAEYVNASAEITAVECVMFPAVKTYISAVGSWYTAPWYAAHANDEGRIDIGPLGTGDNYFEQMIDMYEEYTHVPAENNSLESGYFLTPPEASKVASLLDGFASTFRLSNQAAVSLQRYFPKLLQGTVRRDNISAPISTTAELNGGGSSDALWVIYDSDASFGTCNIVPNFWGELANNGKNVPCALDAMAASFTAMMRVNQNISLIPGEFATTAWGFHNGTTIAPITQVNVTWFWIILPAIIWCCSIAMVIGTAVKTKKAKVHLWRTNPLAMVFLTLGRDERQEVRELGGLSEQGLIQRAENIKVKLTVQDGQDIMLRKPRAQED